MALEQNENNRGRLDCCLGCGKPLPEPRKLRDFCSYSCRGQHAVDSLDGPKYQTALTGSKNTRKTKALQSLRRASIAGIAFAKINSITYRIDQPSKKAVGWLMEVAWPGESRQRWVARVGNQASEPLPLEEAKKAAQALLSERGKAKPRDWIAELNQQAANEVDRAVIRRARHKWPVDLMGGNQRGAVEPGLRQAILDTERVRKDELVMPANDYQPEHDAADGYPELPAFLDRRPKPALSEAA